MFCEIASFAGSCRVRRSQRSGFTLIEILLVIALIGLLGGFLLVDWANMADSFGRRGWKQSLEESFRRAHFLAETGDQPIRLRFDAEEGIAILENAEDGALIESISIGGVEEIRRVGSRDRATGLASGPEGDFFSVRFGRDGSAEAIVFEVTRDRSQIRFRNHPFSGRLADADEEIWGQ